MSKKHLLYIIVFIAISCFNFTTSTANEQIKIGWVFAMANAPIIIAQQKEYFSEFGVDVEALPFSSGPLVHQALAAGELDMAYIGAPPVYHWFSRGLDSRILAKVNYGQAAIMVRSDSTIKTLKDLIGKKIAGVRKGSGMDVLLRGFVLREYSQINPRSDLKIIPMKPGNMGASLLHKVVDAAFVWEPYTSQYELTDKMKVIFDMNEAIPRYPWYIIMAMPNALKNKRSSVIKVLRAHKKAVEFLNSSSDAGNSIIAKVFNLQKFSNSSGAEISGEQIVKNARKRLGWSYQITESDSAFIQQLMNYSYQLRYIKNKMNSSEIIDNSLMQQISQ